MDSAYTRFKELSLETLVALLLTALLSERCDGQGCDGFHARHVGKLAFDLKVTTCIHPA